MTYAKQGTRYYESSSNQVTFEKLTDKQKAILNDIAYADILSGWKAGERLVDVVGQVDKQLAQIIKDNGLGHLVIKDYVNNNDGRGSGFCGIAFEDSITGEVGMSFRGTEGLDGLGELIRNPKDMADNTLTMSIGISPQSLEALAFFQNNKDRGGNNYLYGHSKGGELAAGVYVTNYDEIKGVHVINAQPINPFKLTPDQLIALKLSKFDAVVVNGDIVSFLGVNVYPVRYVKNNGNDDSFFGPHSTGNILYNESGNAVREEKPFSGHFWQGVSAVTGTILLGGMQSLLRPYSFAVNIIVRVGYFLIYKLPEMLNKFVENIIKAIDRFKEFSKEVKATLKNFVVGIVKSVSSRFKEVFNSGFKYATANPVIKLETYKLRNYADRLRKVNARLSALDNRMDSLYWRVGLLDLLTLMQADLMTGESRTIKKCISYLDETAQSFEEVEKRVMNQL